MDIALIARHGELMRAATIEAAILAWASPPCQVHQIAPRRSIEVDDNERSTTVPTMTTTDLYAMRWPTDPNPGVLTPGVRFWDERVPEDEQGEMTLESLQYLVRNDPEFAFADGETIADASSHSDAELWSDVIVPAIIAGTFSVSTWGTVITIEEG